MSSANRGDDVSWENIPVKPIVYYQKPVIGDVVTGDPLPPLQIVFPNGNFGLGIPVRDQNDPGQENQGNYPVVSSGAETARHDKLEKNGLKYSFLILAFFNLTITCLMYANADTTDVSKVEYPTGNYPTVFELVSSNRSYTENVNFAFFLISLFIGVFSAFFELPLGLSAYALYVVVNFLLGTSALPYFFFSLRYIFDLFMLYTSLVLRSRLVYTFLPVHLHRN